MAQRIFLICRTIFLSGTDESCLPILTQKTVTSTSFPTPRLGGTVIQDGRRWRCRALWSNCVAYRLISTAHGRSIDSQSGKQSGKHAGPEPVLWPGTFVTFGLKLHLRRLHLTPFTPWRQAVRHFTIGLRSEGLWAIVSVLSRGPSDGMAGL